MFSFGKRAAPVGFFLAGIVFLSIPATVLAQGTTGRGATAAPDGCNVRAGSNRASLETIENIALNNGAPSSTWYCQCATAGSAVCVSGGCPGGATLLCCIPGTGQPPPSSNVCPSAAATSTSGRVGLAAIVLPRCVTSHDASTAGKCTLTDILNVGISFANFLLGLSGALLLGIFVYAGTRYILFSYNSSEVSKAKDMIRNAVVGMLIIILAGTMVRFAKQALLTSSTTGRATTSQTVG